MALPSRTGGVFSTWREVSALPIGSGTDAGAPTVYLRLNGHRYKIGLTGGAPILPPCPITAPTRLGERWWTCSKSNSSRSQFSKPHPRVQSSLYPLFAGRNRATRNRPRSHGPQNDIFRKKNAYKFIRMMK
jgi:hypothetical protein